MDMRIIETGHDRAALQGDTARCRAGQRGDRDIVADRQDSVAGDRQGRSVRLARVHRVNLAASQD
jgi:hypothetical protein